MTINQRIIQALTPLGLPVAPDTDTESRERCFVFSADQTPTFYCDDAPLLYSFKVQVYGRDIMQDMKAIQDDIAKASRGEKNIPSKTLEVFENIAYLMAKHARPDEVTASSAEEWLDGFDTFSIYQVFPAIIQLWQFNLRTTSTPKKKRGRRRGR